MERCAWDEFFARLADSPRRLLMLDYDGTLAPLRVARDLARPYPGVCRALRGIQADGGTRLALVSGRAAEEVVRLLGLNPAPEVWGCHGWERMRPGREAAPPQLPSAARRGLAQGRARLEEAGLLRRLESKPAALAVHWRGLGLARARRVAALARAAWAPLAAAGGLQLRPFAGGLELRAAGRDKGHAVRTLLRECGPRTVAAYLGDDLTDEDAFRAIAGRGLGVLVRRRPRASAAAARLVPPAQLLRFLELWRAAARRDAASGPRRAP